jgi:hypothetical protein
LHENEVSGDTEAASLITASSAQTTPNLESDAGRTVPIESRKPIPDGSSIQLAVSEGRSLMSYLYLSLVTDVSQINKLPTQNSLELAAPSRMIRSLRSQVRSDRLLLQHFTQLGAEDVEEETNNTGEDLTEAAEDGGHPTGLADTLEQGAVGHDNTRGHDALIARTATPALPSSIFPESADLHQLTEVDDEADTWELDDGYGAWDETFEGDDLDTALAGEPDSASTGSSTLSGKTTSIASKRSFGEVEVEESESLVEQSLLQSQFAVRKMLTCTDNVIFRSEKNTNAVTILSTLFGCLGPPTFSAATSDFLTSRVT